MISVSLAETFKVFQTRMGSVVTPPVVDVGTGDMLVVNCTSGVDNIINERLRDPVGKVELLKRQQIQTAQLQCRGFKLTAFVMIR